MALVFVAFPPCAYYGFDVMHDDLTGGKTGAKSYAWLLAPLGVLVAGIAYASSDGVSSSAPPVELDLASTETPARVESSSCTAAAAPSGEELKRVLDQRASSRARAYANRGAQAPRALSTSEAS